MLSAQSTTRRGDVPGSVSMRMEPKMDWLMRRATNRRGAASSPCGANSHAPSLSMRKRPHADA